MKYNVPLGLIGPAKGQQVKRSKVALALALAATAISAASAAETSPPATNAPAKDAQLTAKAEKPPPLPLHNIEGNGGIFSTLSAYLVNPPRDGEPVGRPSAGFSFVELGHGRNLEALTVTETPWKRLELGYGYNNFDLGDLPFAVSKATAGAANIQASSVTLHNFNARLQLLKEGDFEQKWVPALTFGSHYKLNDTYSSINHDVGGLLYGHGVTKKQGEDFTLYASKLFTFLPRPVLLELGGRATEAAHIGLLGFTDNYNFVFEGNVVVFLTDRLALAAEYRQKPSDYQPVGNLIPAENDWWTVDVAYVVNKHFTVAAGYGHFGDVLNHEANGVWGITTKFEF